MSSIIENKARIGNFTSSEIAKLFKSGKGENGFGTAAITFIKETNQERKLGRSITVDAYSKPMAWGTFLQQYLFDTHLEFGWQLIQDKTEVHPTIDYWAGSADLLMPGIKIGEIKCYEPSKFSYYADALMSGNIETLKTEFADEYWQAVSNSVIYGVSKAELILFMPFKSELPAIRELAETYDGSDQWKYRFIAESEDYSLAHLPNNGYYKNLVRFEFEVPSEDIELLTSKVELAGSMLIERIVYDNEEVVEPPVSYPSDAPNYFSSSASFLNAMDSVLDARPNGSDIVLVLSESDLVELEDTFYNVSVAVHGAKAIKDIRLTVKKTRIEVVNEAEAQKRNNPSEKKAINSEKNRIVARLKALELHLKNLK